jgi:chromate transporter
VRPRVGLGEVLREWGRIGTIGFGGPAAHVALLRELCVERRGWIDAREFADAYAAANLLPGPASTQMAIFCAQRVAGRPGAVVGGLAFILPGLVVLLALAVATLGEAPPDWVRGTSAAAGAAVVAVVAQAGVALVRSSLVGRRGPQLVRGLAYVAVGAVATALLGAGVVVALLACGVVELVWQSRLRLGAASIASPLVIASSAAAIPGLAWTAFKVGGLSYGGGYVIVPLMQADAVDVHHWMSHTQFLDAVALGQVTPGPVTHTVAAVGYSAAGLGGAVVAAAIAFAPSFAFVMLGGERFVTLRSNATARAFLDGAGPAAIGAILGATVLLLDGIDETWQVGVLAAAVVALFWLRLGLVTVLVGAAAVGAVVAVAGGPLPG